MDIIPYSKDIDQNVKKISFSGNLHKLKEFTKLEEIRCINFYDQLYLKLPELIKFEKLRWIDSEMTLTLFNPIFSFSFPVLEYLVLNIECINNPQLIENFVSSIKSCPNLKKLTCTFNIPECSSLKLDLSNTNFEFEIFSNIPVIVIGNTNVTINKLTNILPEKNVNTLIVEDDKFGFFQSLERLRSSDPDKYNEAIKSPWYDQLARSVKQ